MDIGHSRLLKFLPPNNLEKPIMSERQELRVEYISKPTNVESLVPEQQKLRESLADKDKTQNNGDQSDTAKDHDSTFVPVFTTKKEEAVFTKGDLKLQKVSVSEDISETKIVNAMYSEIQSEDIKNKQPIKTVPKDVQSDNEPTVNKPRSKIPMFRHKTEKKDRDETKTKKVPSRQLRRSSIPKVKKIEPLPNKEREKGSTDNKHKPNGQEKIIVEPAANEKNIVPPEQEFDKIFDEIIHKDVEPILNVNVLVDGLEDPEKLEHSFEEIMHDYEENKVQPIDIQQVRSKRPYVRQKSLPEAQFARKLERRASLKDSPINKNENTTEVSKSNDTKIRKKSANEKLDSLQTNVLVKTKLSDTSSEKATHLEPSSKNDHAKSIAGIRQTNTVVTPALQINRNNNSKAKVNKDMKDKSDNLHSGQECISPAREQCNTGEESLNKIRDESFENEYRKQIIEAHLENKPVKKDDVVTLNTTTRESSETTPEIKETPITDIPKLRGKVSLLTSRFSANEKSSTIPSKKEIFPKKKSTNSRTGVFNKNASIENDNSNLDYHIDITTIKESSDIILNNVSNEVNKKDIKEQPHHETHLNNKLPNNAKKDSDQDELDESSNLAAKIRRDSVEKLKFERSDSLTTSITNTLNINHKLNLKSVTPPNTPQVHDYEPYKDNACLIGEPKILNIDDNETQEKEENMKSIVPHQETNKVDQHNVNVQNIKSEQPNISDHSKHLSSEIYNKIDTDKDQSIDFNSPNLHEFERAPLFESVNEKVKAESKTNESEGETFAMTGKVTKIISTIDSIDATPLNETKKENVELPLKKSVSTRIAMFERQTLIPSETKPNFKLLLDTKPKIIEEVLKAQPPRQSIVKPENHNSCELKDVENADKHQPQTKDSDVDNVIYSKNIEHVANVVEIQDTLVDNIQRDVLPRTLDNESAEKNKSTNRRIYSDNELLKDNEILKWQKTETLVNIKEKFERVKSINEEGILNKSKTVAELDIGDSIKGKVHQMIVRMNSIEKIELEKKFDNIDIRERPRKKSVSEKIALFEAKKLMRSLKNLDVDGGGAIRLSDSAKPEAQSNKKSKPKSQPETNAIPETTPVPDTTTDDYKQRIEALQNAKLKYGRMNDMMYIKLKNGQDLPVLSLGTALLDPTLLPYIIGAAIDLGYRGIDTAFIYGNEKQIGLAIKAKIDDGTVKREELFITGKLWSTFHRQELVEKACLASLEALGLEYFDLYLIHNPMSFKEGGSPLPMIANVLQYSDSDYLQAWYGMEGLVEKGLAKGIGLSNFNSEQVAKVVDKGKIKPVVNQVECHPYLTQQRLDLFCSDRNITLQCFGTLGSKSTPAQYKDNQEAVIDDPMVRVMAAGLNISPARLLLRYQIECSHGIVTKTSSADRLWDNLQAQTFTLSAAQVDALHALNRNKRTYMFKGMGDTHRNYPFKIPY